MAEHVLRLTSLLSFKHLLRHVCNLKPGKIDQSCEITFKRIGTLFSLIGEWDKFFRQYGNIYLLSLNISKHVSLYLLLITMWGRRLQYYQIKYLVLLTLHIKRVYQKLPLFPWARNFTHSSHCLVLVGSRNRFKSDLHKQKLLVSQFN